MVRRCMRYLVISWSVLLLIILLSCMKGPNVTENQVHGRIQRNDRNAVQKVLPEYDTGQPLIFVGGPPRSGTTLMRTMLDAHPDIRCGPETHVIPRLLGERWGWTNYFMERLEEGGVVPDVLDEAMAKFILTIILKHGPPSKYYCHKDPHVLSDTAYLHHLFPNAKFILMIRDGRAATHSIVSRKVPMGSEIDIKSYRAVLNRWNEVITRMYRLCNEAGTRFCLVVRYEQLVLQPIATTLQIFQFLNITWREEVLYHEKHLNGTKLSLFEFSTDQVRRPLYLDALTEWFGSIPVDVEREVAEIAPMLSILGYDPDDPTPFYGPPDNFMKAKIRKHSNSKF